MRISELERNNVIRLYTHDELRSFLAIVDETGGTNQKYGIYFWAIVETEAGKKIKIDDRWDFEKVDEPFTRKVDMQEQQDVVHKPKHYTYGDIEVIDYIEQVTKNYKPELAFAIGNAIKYISRANHKNGKEDLDKSRWYLNRAFENWED
nr:MAG TPA_asm: nucelotide kinase [Caudoviricetes sp.]